MKIFFFTDGFYVISFLLKQSHLHVTIKSLVIITNLKKHKGVYMP